MATAGEKLLEYSTLTGTHTAREHFLSIQTSDSETLTTGDIYADQNFIDVGYAEFGFLGDEFSYFDYENGIWVHDDTQMIRARASDLARAIAYKYGLVWDDRTDINWIGNFIAYLRTYNEEDKQFRLYAPSITPEDNYNNFPLIVRDEYGNQQLRGISILIKQPLITTPDGSEGIILPFRKV